MGIAVIIFTLCVIGLVIYVNHLMEVARRKEMRRWAVSHNLRFNSVRDPSARQRFPAFKVLEKGSNQYAFNVALGSWSGRGFTAFDYHYETYSYGRSGRQTHHHYFSALLFFSRIPLKSLSIRPEGVLDRMAEFIGVDDIDFESAEFSRRFYVKATDRKWAYDVLHPRTIQFMLRMPNFFIEFGPHAVMAYQTRRMKPNELNAGAELVLGILERLPDYLLEQQGGKAVVRNT